MTTASNCAWKYPRDVQSLLAMSPYAPVLRQRQFVELSNELCDLANHDWRFHQQCKYAVAQLFAGAILFRSDSHHAIMANTVEAYGRGKSVDVHREPFGVVKGVPVETSLPPANGYLYHDVWPTTISTKDGQKLVIGTQSCNLLVTSSLRLDNADKTTSRAYIGATTINFVLDNKVASKNCMIFLDMESVVNAQTLASDTTATGTNKFSYLYQLRQLNSKFDDPTTYYLTRCSGPITRAHNHQPYTVFTLTDHNNTKNAGAMLMNTVGMLVLQHGKEAQLNKADVQRLLSTATGEIRSVLVHIASLFGNSEQHIHIFTKWPADLLAGQID